MKRIYYYCSKEYGPLLKGAGVSFAEDYFENYSMEDNGEKVEKLRISSYGVSRLRALKYRVSFRHSSHSRYSRYKAICIEISKKQDSDLSRKKYLKICKSDRTANASFLSKKLEKLQSEIQKYKTAMIKKIREAEAIRRKLNTGRRNSTQNDAENFNAILKMKKVAGISVVGRDVVVHTKTIYCMDRIIGEFDIVIENDDIRFFNQTRRVDGYENSMNHPHVWCNGEACLGNISPSFVELLSVRDYPALVMLSIQFLEHVNVYDTAGRYINCWPLKK